MDKIIINNVDAFGSLWTIGWLFTIGYLGLSFKQGFFALFIWPYYIGVKFSKHSTKSE